MDAMIRASEPNVATLAALLADPVRAQMAYALMDGRALTAGELARVGGVTAQTASTHLAQLVDGGVLSVARQGRHRYYRISGDDAAGLLEQMAVVAGTLDHRAVPRTGPRDPHMRQARVCYDHLAGAMGVRLFAGLVESGTLTGDAHAVSVTPAGADRLRSLGVDVEGLRSRRRPVCRTCIDWSERRPHLAGGLGAALLDHFLANGWAHRVEGARILRFTSDGLRRFEELVRA
ncbi:MAG: winged helix-turn-helix domain-containing protein [Phyllobacteriaceae bacterium]|jgi:DNA-binding transcriptional ArsR family regulator|nr:winged helix-turn-helix domain-containing protein [Phyllobacteriaceae bacterium]